MQRKTIKLFWQIAMRYPVRTWIALLNSGLTATVGGFIAPFIISQLLQLLQDAELTFQTGLPFLIAYTLAQVYGQIIGGRISLFATWTMETAGQRDLYKLIFTKLSNHSLGFHANRFGGSLVSQTTKLVGSFERFWDTLIWQLVPGIASILAAITILSFFFWQYALIMGIVSILFVIVVYFGSRYMRKASREEAQAMTASNGYVADAITNISTIKAHGSENYEIRGLSKKVEVWRGKSLNNMRAFLKISTAYSFLITLLYVSAFLAAIWAAEHNAISVATVYLAVSYTFTVGRQLWEMNGIMRNYHRLIGDAHDMVEIIGLEPEVKDTSKKVLHVTKGVVELKNVVFTHQDSNEALFYNFSLFIPHGQRVGLVGHSGSGKTTLTRLLLRFSDLDGGQILIDGQDISKVTQKSLRESIAYVPQEPMLFHRSLYENIGYSNPDASKDEIVEAARKANALEFIEKLPKGFETLVGERGIKLSGGQRQRVAIARAILKDAPILLLDEATSALDSESEKLIQDALQKLMKGRTSIVIAHRLSTIAKLDRIVVLDNGQIIEDGSHQKLLKDNGRYASLWAHQSGGFLDE